MKTRTYTKSPFNDRMGEGPEERRGENWMAFLMFSVKIQFGELVTVPHGLGMQLLYC